MRDATTARIVAGVTDGLSTGCTSTASALSAAAIPQQIEDSMPLRQASFTTTDTPSGKPASARTRSAWAPRTATIIVHSRQRELTAGVGEEARAADREQRLGPADPLSLARREHDGRDPHDGH